MATPETTTSVLKKDPLPVSEVPSNKKVVLVKEKSTEETTEDHSKQSTEMEVDNSFLEHDDDGDVIISPSNQM